MYCFEQLLYKSYRSIYYYIPREFVCLQGVMLVSDLSSEQVEALAGGPLLQQEVINLGAQQASAKAISRTSNRLVAALRNVRRPL